MSNSVVLDLTTKVNGRQWNLYAIDYETADGPFSTYLHAISAEHAAAMVAELRETAELRGQVMGVVEAGE